jgi:hypothetical protein
MRRGAASYFDLANFDRGGFDSGLSAPTIMQQHGVGREDWNGGMKISEVVADIGQRFVGAGQAARDVFGSNR